MAPPILDHQVVDLTDADEFDTLSIALASARALELADEAIADLRSAAATADTDTTRDRLRDAIQSLDRAQLLLSAVLDDVHQAASSHHHPAPASFEITA